MELRNDYGCFFIKMKKTHEVGFIIYIKTNFLLKCHPEMKLNYFDVDKKVFSVKPFSRNKIFYIGFSGKDGIGGEALDEYTLQEFRKLFEKTVEEIYNCSDYSSHDELYTAMKNSKTGLPSVFTKKWFEEQYKFIDGQYASIDNCGKLVTTRTASPARSNSKHRRHRKNGLRRTRKHIS